MSSIIGFFTQIYNSYGIPWLIGQGFGIVAIILGFVSYQMRTQRQVLFMQTMVATVFCLHYGLIGAYSALAMNCVCIVRNVVYDYRARKGIRSQLIPVIFVAIQIVICILTWEALYSIFILLGLGINTYCMSFYNPQSVRKSILITCPMVLTYDIFAYSIGGCIYETIAMISAAIGIVRYRKKGKKALPDE